MLISRIIATMMLSVLCMVIVYKSSQIPNRINNGFKRSYSKSLSLISSLEIENHLNSLIENTSSEVYVSTLTPGEIYITNHSGEMLQHIFFRLNNIKKKKNDDLIIPLVYPPNIYFINFNYPNILVNTLNNFYVSNTLVHSTDFTKAVFADSGVLILRRFNSENQDQVFSRYFLGTERFETEHDFSEIFHDGGISTDGTLNYDKAKGICTYVYYYKNKIIVFDKDLNFIKTIKTVDTFSNFQISVGKDAYINSQSYTITNNAPGNMLNIRSRIGNGRLYILSSVKADNDPLELFEKNNVIDIYDIDSAKYSGSIYVPKYGYKNLSDFKILNDTLTVLYKESVKCFRISNFNN